jgi:uncharacterized protein YndB with AHSA1/START domain
MTVEQQPRPVTMTTPTELELRFERVFNAPRDTVWRAFTDPSLIGEWWGGGTRVEAMDVRVGGTYRFVADRPDASYAFEGQYIEVDPPKRLVQTSHNGWNGMNATETLEFEELGGQTRFTQTSRFESTELRDSAVQNGAQMGANFQFHQLDQLLARLSASAE